MSDELSQLDELNESDIMAALGQDLSTQISETKDQNTDEAAAFANETEDGEVTNIPDGLLEKEDTQESSEEFGEELDDVGDIEILPMAEIESAIEDQDDETISMSSNDLGSLASILSKLLNNKTIEITIKVKD